MVVGVEEPQLYVISPLGDVSAVPSPLLLALSLDRKGMRKACTVKGEGEGTLDFVGAAKVEEGKRKRQGDEISRNMCMCKQACMSV